MANGIYTILHADRYITKGVLQWNTISEILDRKAYPRSIHAFLLDMMQKFEVCFPLPGGNDTAFLLPDLLPKEEPSVASWTDGWDESLRFLYVYPTALPHSILSRLMVRLNPFIDFDTLWFYGCVIESHDTANRTRIELDPTKRQIEIQVIGTQATRRETMRLFRHHFALLHHLFADLHIEEQVPLPGTDDRTTSYTYLLQLEQAGVTQNWFEGISEVVDIQALLNGFSTPQDRALDLLRTNPSALKDHQLAALQEDLQQYRRGHILPTTFSQYDQRTPLHHQEEQYHRSLQQRIEREKREQ